MISGDPEFPIVVRRKYASGIQPGRSLCEALLECQNETVGHAA